MTISRYFSVMTWIWLLRRCAWYVGWLPMVLVLALLGAWGILLQHQADQKTQITQLELEIRQLEQQPIKTKAKLAPVLAKPVSAQLDQPHSAENLAGFWQQLPVFADLSPRMMQIAGLAQKHQIALNVGDYQWHIHPANTGEQAVQQYDMRFTIQTDYATCRQFIVDVLRQIPSIALTELELRKNETTQPMLEASLTFSVFIRGGQAYAK